MPTALSVGMQKHEHDSACNKHPLNTNLMNLPEDRKAELQTTPPLRDYMPTRTVVGMAPGSWRSAATEASTSEPFPLWKQ